jgi:hypothetical protein
VEVRVPGLGGVKSGELVLSVGRQAQFTMKPSTSCTPSGFRSSARRWTPFGIGRTSTYADAHRVRVVTPSSAARPRNDAPRRVGAQAEFDKWIEEQKA